MFRNHVPNNNYTLPNNKLTVPQPSVTVNVPMREIIPLINNDSQNSTANQRKCTSFKTVKSAVSANSPVTSSQMAPQHPSTGDSNHKKSGVSSARLYSERVVILSSAHHHLLDQTIPNFQINHRPRIVIGISALIGDNNKSSPSNWLLSVCFPIRRAVATQPMKPTSVLVRLSVVHYPLRVRPIKPTVYPGNCKRGSLFKPERIYLFVIIVINAYYSISY